MNGQIIKEKIAARYKMIVRMGPNQKHEKFIMEFRLVAPAEEHFYNLTKFQALKYLSDAQGKSVEAYEDIYKVLTVYKTSLPFSRYLDEVKKLEATCSQNETYGLVLDARKNLKSIKF